MAGRATRKEWLARSFDRSAPLYERGRPEYPASAIRFAARTFDLRKGSVVVDLAAGTGKLTRGLRATGATIVAVEPMPGMRRVFRRILPDIPVVDGRAEAIPLPSGFADAVFVGQAFHWFRVRPALREIARVLRPGGALVLVWNTRDQRVRWSRSLTRLIEAAGGRKYWTGASDPDWRKVLRRGSTPFGRIRKRTFPHAQTATLATILARILSVSHVASQPPAVQRRVRRQIRTLLATDPLTRGRKRVVLPYRTEVFYTRKRPDRRGRVR
jgi:SAM-dependent methyltransferase